MASPSSSPEPSAAPSTDENAAPLDPNSLCRYTSKKCTNPRVRKRTGELHSFCALHRANANRNQRRVDMRRRMQRLEVQAIESLCTAVPIEQAEAAAHAEDAYEPLRTPVALREEDLATLTTLFVGEPQPFVPAPPPMPAAAPTHPPPSHMEQPSMSIHGFMPTAPMARQGTMTNMPTKHALTQSFAPYYPAPATMAASPPPPQPHQTRAFRHSHSYDPSPPPQRRFRHSHSYDPSFSF